MGNQTINSISDVVCKDITQKDFDKIGSLYGANLEDIYDIGAGQKWILDTSIRNNSSFVMSMLFKADIPVNPKSFREKVNEVSRKQESLRFAYVHKGLSKPYIVLLRNRLIELHFDDISAFSAERQKDIMNMAHDSSIRRGFDLEKDSLVRITVYKLAENRHAFLMTMHHINSDGTSVGLLMKDVFIDYALNLSSDDFPMLFSYKSYAQYLESIDKADELSCWKEYLNGIPESNTIPGMQQSVDSCHNASETVLYSPELEAKLEQAQKKFKTTQFSILAAAWSVMMNRINGSEDIVFGIMSSGREMGPDKNMLLTGGFAIAVPLRLHVSENKHISEILKEVQSGMILSTKCPHCSIGEIEDALGRNEPIFSYILNCQNFMSGSETNDVGIPGFQVMSVDMSGDMSSDLTVCFTSTTEGNGIVFGYNEDVFSKETVALYAECFMSTLDAIASGEDVLVSELPEFEEEKFEAAKNESMLSELKRAALIKELPFLDICSDADKIKVARDSTIRVYKRNEKIYDYNDNMESVICVIKGTVSISVQRDDGWIVPSESIRDGELYCLDSFLNEVTAKSSALSDSDECIVAFIPSTTMKWLLTEYPELCIELLKELIICYDRLSYMYVNNRGDLCEL